MVNESELRRAHGRLNELRQRRRERMEETYASGAPVSLRVEPGYLARVHLVVEHFFPTMEEAQAWVEENAPSTFLAQMTDREDPEFAIRQSSTAVEYRDPGRQEPPW